MNATFQILENKNGELSPISKGKVDSLSIGGYCFIINGKKILFDWEAFCGDEDDCVFDFSTGYGFLWNDFELSDCFDDYYETIGIKREDITAKFLSEVDEIAEFSISFFDGDDDECSFGSNTDIEDYKIKLLKIEFVDMETEESFNVRQDVIYDFNKELTTQHEWFGQVRWCEDDLKEALRVQGYPATENNVAKLKALCEHHFFTDCMIERGWEYMYDSIGCDNGWDK
jgi:hypothetical protein